MQVYSKPLGDAVKRARGELDLTQSQVAEAANIDVRTVLNIENYKGNPKMEVLYPAGSRSQTGFQRNLLPGNSSGQCSDTPSASDGGRV